MGVLEHRRSVSCEAEEKTTIPGARTLATVVEKLKTTTVLG